MKELEKTKRISISTVLFILVIVIGVLTFRKPTNVYRKSNVETLAKLKTEDYLVVNADIDHSSSVLIDIRDKFDYSINHLENAVNIPTSDILNESSISLLDEIRDMGKTAVLYGKNPNEANSAFILLYQLGYENIKILNSTTQLVDNEFQVKDYDLEKPIANYMDIFKKVEPEEPIVVKKAAPKPPKKVITIQKKKKRKPEGGC
jgi:rhodanese-related sulfurtransferase